MTLSRSTVLFFILLQAALGQTMRLNSGVPRRFTLGLQRSPTFITGFTIAVPPVLSRLTINLEPHTPSVDVTLVARFEREFVVQGESVDGTIISPRHRAPALISIGGQAANAPSSP